MFRDFPSLYKSTIWEPGEKFLKACRPPHHSEKKARIRESGESSFHAWRCQDVHLSKAHTYTQFQICPCSLFTLPSYTILLMPFTESYEIITITYEIGYDLSRKINK